MMIFLSAIVVLVITFAITRTFNLSPRYERRNRSPWQQLDHGDDPTDEQ